jgi:hypothetical protein
VSDNPLKPPYMMNLEKLSLNDYLNQLMRVAKENELIPLDASSNPIELNWDYFNWYGYIDEARYTEAHLALCNLGYTFDNYKK